MENRFFTLLWRFNAFVIALIGLGTLAVLAFAITELWDELSRDRYAIDVVNIDSSDETLVQTYSWGEMRQLSSGFGYQLPLYIVQDYRASGYDKSTSRNTVNYLNIAADQTQTWVFETHNQLITDNHSIHRPIDAERLDRKTVARILAVVESDSNGDDRLSQKDRFVLYMSDPDSRALTPLISDVDSYKIHADWQAEHVLFSITRASDTRIFQYDLATKELEDLFTLPPLPNSE